MCFDYNERGDHHNFYDIRVCVQKSGSMPRQKLHVSVRRCLFKERKQNTSRVMFKTRTKGLQLIQSYDDLISLYMIKMSKHTSRHTVSC